VAHKLRPWHWLIVVSFVAVLLIGVASSLDYEKQQVSQNILINLGTGLLGSCVTYLLFDVYFRYIRNISGTTRTNFDYSRFAKNIQRSKNRVRIMSTYINALTNIDKHKHDKNALVEAIRSSIEKNPDLDFQFVFLNPNSEAAKQRALERRDDDVIKRIEENLAEMHRVKDTKEFESAFSKVKVKIYDRLLPMILFQWDDKASISFLQRNSQVSETERFEFATETPLGIFMNDTFHSVWDDPNAMDLDEYMHLKIQIEDKISHNTKEASVHFIEVSSSEYYLLLNVVRDSKDAMDLINRDPEKIRVKVSRNKQVQICEHKQVNQQEDLRNRALRKYGTFDCQHIVRLDIVNDQI
jgi:hypothetical protein